MGSGSAHRKRPSECPCPHPTRSGEKSARRSSWIKLNQSKSGLAHAWDPFGFEISSFFRHSRAIRKISTNFDKFDPAFGKISINFDRLFGKIKIWLFFKQFRTISKTLANSPVFSKHLRASRTTRRKRGLPPLGRQHPAVRYGNL